MHLFEEVDEIQRHADGAIQLVKICPIIKQGEIDFLKQHGLLNDLIKKRNKFNKGSRGKHTRNLLQELGVINIAATAEKVLKERREVSVK